MTARRQALQSGKSAQRSFSMQHPATGMALSLGACSGNNNTGTPNVTTPPTDENGGSNGGTQSSELQAAEKAETDARTAAMEATAAATAAETNARTKIAETRTALALAVSRACSVAGASCIRCSPSRH